MTLELLKANIEKEKEIIKEVNIIYNQLYSLNQLEIQGKLVNKKEKELLNESLTQLIIQLKIINSAIPNLFNNLPFYEKLDKKSQIKLKQETPKVKEVTYGEKKKKTIAIPKKEEKKFLQTIKKTDKKVVGEVTSNSYIRMSNKFFRDFSTKLVKKNYFDSLDAELRKITSPYIITSYVSMIFFTTVLSFFAGILLFIILLFTQVSMLVALSILFFTPLIVFLIFYSYPSSQRKSFEKDINQELPFVTIYLSAIGTSGIEPSKIFEILIRTKDFPATRREIKKLINYINFYGYDLVTALKKVSKNNPSEKLSILLSGLATTITSGGQITNFLDKHAETLLFDYRLEREKYTKIAETFMDIYISVVIAAPMIMMMLFALLGLTGFGGGSLSPGILSILIIFIITILNILFLFFINLKQPKF